MSTTVGTNPDSIVEAVAADLTNWLREALEDDSIDGSDNFLEVGGHSLMANELILSLKARHGVTVSIAALFELTLQEAAKTLA